MLREGEHEGEKHTHNINDGFGIACTIIPLQVLMGVNSIKLTLKAS